MCARFVPTTPILDVTNTQGKSFSSSEFKEYMIRLTKFLDNVATTLNTKPSGEFATVEDVSGKQYWPLTGGNYPRASNHIYIDFGALPDGTSSVTKSVNHNINFPAGSIWVQVRGMATNTTTGLGVGLPFSSPTLANNIQLSVSSTQVTVIVDATIDWSSYNNTWIYLEWI